jgi:hypothetical protein
VQEKNENRYKRSDYGRRKNNRGHKISHPDTSMDNEMHIKYWYILINFSISYTMYVYYKTVMERYKKL